MAFRVKRRGKLTYYYSGGKTGSFGLVTEDLGKGDLKIHFAGLTGGHSSTGILGLNTVHTMNPAVEVELVFRCWGEMAARCRNLRFHFTDRFHRSARFCRPAEGAQPDA